MLAIVLLLCLVSSSFFSLVGHSKVHADGSNNSPILTITSSGNRTINLKAGSNTFTISGKVSDPDNNKVTVTAIVGGITKSIFISNTNLTKDWSLTWETAELNSGAYATIKVSANDGIETTTTNYNGTLTVDKTPLYYWDKYTVKEKTQFELKSGKQETVYQGDVWAYQNYSFDKDTGRWGVHNPRLVQAGEYGSFVLDRWGTLTFISYLGVVWNPNTRENEYGWSYTSMIIQEVSTGEKIKDTLLNENIIDVDGTYPDNGLHQDGYWYVKKAINNRIPVVTLNQESKVINASTTEDLQINGTVKDVENDNVQISVTVAGITKTTSVNASSTAREWVLRWTKGELPEGTFIDVFVIADDGKGGAVAAVYDKNILIDKTGPSAPTISVSPEGWTNQNVQVNVTPGIDSISGISKTEYSISNGSWQTYTAPLTISTEGITSIKARSIDGAGNAGALQAVKTMIVKNPPTTPSIKLDSGSIYSKGWYKGPVNFDISGSTGYGNIQYEYKIGDGPFQSGTSEVIDLEGRTSVTARAINEAGIGNETQAIVQIDKTGPTATLTPNSSEWTSNSVRLKVDVVDEYSGVSQVKYKVLPTPMFPSKGFEVLDDDEIVIANEGEWYVHLFLEDEVGNQSFYSSQAFKIQSQPASPENVRATNVQENQVTIQWDLPQGNVYTDGYVYEIRNTVTGATYSVSYPENQITDYSVVGGRTYEYIATVKNHVGQSSAESISVLTKPDGPEQMQVQKVGRDYSKALLTFIPSVGADSYRVIVKDSAGNNLIDEIINTNSYTINGLLAGSNHNITVHGINSTGQGPGNSISFLSLPDTPGGFSGASIEENAITLKWLTVTSATYYDLERFTDLIYEGPDLEFKDIGLDSGSIYDYQVTAANDTGAGEYAELTNLITLPAKPSNVQITGATENSMTMQWDLVTGADNYLLESNRGDREIVYSTQHTFQGLDPGQEYEYTLTAQNRSGQGKSVNITGVTIPEQPHGLNVEQIEETTAEITWNSSAGADKYMVRIEDKEYEVSGNRLQLNGLTGSKSYRFTVSAGNKSGYGVSAASEFLTKPYAPSDLSIQSVTKDAITLIWEQDETAIGYKAVISGSVDVMDVSKNEVTFKHLEPGKTYGFEVRTINGSGESIPAKLSITTKTLPVNPESIIVTVEEDQVIIEFTPVENGLDHVLIDEVGSEIWRGTEGPIKLSPVTPGKEYHYSIVVENEQGVPSDPSKVEFITIPSSPTGVVVQGIGENSIVFDLRAANKKGVDSIIVYRDGEEIRVINSSENAFTDNNLEPGKEYSYEFKSRNKSGTSSAGISFDVQTTPGAPNGIKVKGVFETSVTFDLSKAKTQGADSIKIRRNGEELRVIEISEKEFIDGSLEAGKKYSYEFLAQNKSGTSKSVAFEVETKKMPPVAGGGGNESSNGNPETGKTPNHEKPIPEEINGDTSDGDEKDKPSPGNQSSFKDIQNSFAREYINELASRGIVKGTSETYYEPVRPITRVEFVSMIVRALNLDSTSQKEMEFKDINLKLWYGKELQAAWDNDVAHGFSDTIFRPHDLINREQASKMLGNVLKAKSENGSPMFTDDDKIASWAKGEVIGLSLKQLITGYPDGSFRPKANLTRAESAALIYRMITLDAATGVEEKISGTDKVLGWPTITPDASKVAYLAKDGSTSGLIKVYDVSTKTLEVLNLPTGSHNPVNSMHPQQHTTLLYTGDGNSLLISYTTNTANRMQSIGTYKYDVNSGTFDTVLTPSSKYYSSLSNKGGQGIISTNSDGSKFIEYVNSTVSEGAGFYLVDSASGNRIRLTQEEVFPQYGAGTLLEDAKYVTLPNVKGIMATSTLEVVDPELSMGYYKFYGLSGDGQKLLSLTGTSALDLVEYSFSDLTDGTGFVAPESATTITASVPGDFETGKIEWTPNQTTSEFELYIDGILSATFTTKNVSPTQNGTITYNLLSYPYSGAIKLKIVEKNSKGSVESNTFTLNVVNLPAKLGNIDSYVTSYVDFMGQKWSLVGDNYLLKVNPTSSSTPFDKNGSGIYDPTSADNIGGYLKNWFEGNATPEEQGMVSLHTWNVPQDASPSNSYTVRSKIGLLTSHEANTLKAGKILNMTGSTSVWLMNTYGGTGYSTMTMRKEGNFIKTSNSNATATYIATLPALHLLPTVSVSGGDGSFSNPFTLSTVPVQPQVPAVTNLVAVADSHEKASLTWDSVPNATGYVVKRDGTVVGNPTSNSFSETGLTADTNYTYTVSAKIGTTEGPVTSVMVKTKTQVQIPQVTNLKVEELRFGYVKISFDPVAGATNYAMKRNGSNIGSGYETFFVHNGPMVTGTDYTYEVRANVNGVQGPAGSITVTAPEKVPTPTNAVGVSNSPTTVNLSWDSVPNATDYIVTLNPSTIRDVITETTATSYEHTGLRPDTTYYYHVQARIGDVYSDPVIVPVRTMASIPLTAPQDFKVTGKTDKTVSFSWTSVPGATGYEIKDVASGAVLYDGGTVTVATISGLSPSTDYTFEIVAKDGSAQTSPSSSVSVTTNVETIPYPAGFTVTKVTYDQVDLIWELVPNVDSYTVYRDGVALDTIDYTFFTDNTVTESTKYIYSVVANKGGQSSQAALKEVNTPARPIDGQAPGMPTGLKVVRAYADKVKLQWDIVLDASEYEVYRNGTNLVYKGPLSVLTDDTTGPEETYAYLVVAVNQFGKTAGAPVSVTTPAEAPQIIITPVPSPAEGTITFNFKVIPEVDKYYVERNPQWTYTSNGDGTFRRTFVNSVTGEVRDYGNVAVEDGSLPFYEEGVSAGQNYHYEITAVKTAADGTPEVVGETEVSIDTPTDGSGVTVPDPNGNGGGGTNPPTTPGDGNNGGGTTPPTNPGDGNNGGSNPGTGGNVSPTPPSGGAGGSTTPPTSEGTGENGKDTSEDGKGAEGTDAPDKTPSESVEFTDVEGSHFASDAIKELSSKGIITGYSNGTFGPNKTVTRAEFAIMLKRALGLSGSSDFSSKFTDFNQNAWYAEELSVALHHRITKGFTDKTFRPNDLIPREQASVMISNILRNAGINNDGTAQEFKDSKDIVAWASEDVKLAVEQGIIKGYANNTFLPKTNITRGETAVLIQRLLKVIE